MDVGREASIDSGMNVTEEDANMNWDKSRQLAERVWEAVKRGESPSAVLPRLGCLERMPSRRDGMEKV